MFVFLTILFVLFVVLCVLWVLVNYPRYKDVYYKSFTIQPRCTGEDNAKNGWK